jgi:hypothetical protein
LGVVGCGSILSAMAGWRSGGEVCWAGRAESACEVCYTGVDAVGFLQERVYAFDVVVVVDDRVGVVFLEAEVEVGCYVGHGLLRERFCWAFSFLIQSSSDLSS